jgi:hypothetical protein
VEKKGPGVGPGHPIYILLKEHEFIYEGGIKSSIEFLNKKRERQGLEPAEPLYTAADAAAVSEHLVTHAYGEPFEPVPGVVARLADAGHILGSAGVVLALEEKGRKVRLMFSGDIGRLRMPLLRDPVAPADVDVLLLDKTGTITLGNRQAVEFLPVEGVDVASLAEAAQLASLADETPEGRSIVELAKRQFGLRGRSVGTDRPSLEAISI